MQQTIVLDESAANSDDVNLAHLFSSVNRKMIAPVDKKGNAQMFHVQVKTLCDHASNELRTTIKTANTGYVTKQAVKAWYRVWRQKFRDAGISMKDLGPYGSVFKPKLQNTGYSSGGDHWGGTAVRSGEWNFSEVVWTSPVIDGQGSLEADDLISKGAMHLIGASNEVSGGDETEMFDSVGMISSWVESRATATGARGSEVVPDSLLPKSDNPLLFARADKVSSEALLEEARDTILDEAPYADSDLDDLFTQAILNHSAADTGMATVSAPCGWLRLETSEAATVEITLLGISDM
jgi:hypothetical protein